MRYHNITPKQPLAAVTTHATAAANVIAIDERHVLLHWGEHAYYIEHRRIDTPQKLVAWCCQIGHQGWDSITPESLARLFRALADRFGWDLTVPA